MGKSVNVLIDYDNAKNLEERVATDVALNLRSLLTSVSEALAVNFPGHDVMSCRLYGGWIALDGQYTFRGGWMLAELPKFRGRIGLLRSRLTLATALYDHSEIRLVGTYRDSAQKMVDAMIIVDLLSMCMDEESALVLVSDDDDFVPCLIAASRQRKKKSSIFLLRKNKDPGSAPNDNTLESCFVKIVNYGIGGR